MASKTITLPDTVDTSTKISAEQFNKLKTSTSSVAEGMNTSSAVSFSGYNTSGLITKVNLSLLRNACNALETLQSGNCCQANCCQECQSQQTNQTASNQGCQTDQTTANQSSANQVAIDQACQSSANQANCASGNQACQYRSTCCCCGM